MERRCFHTPNPAGNFGFRFDARSIVCGGSDRQVRGQRELTRAHTQLQHRASFDDQRRKAAIRPDACVRCECPAGDMRVDHATRRSVSRAREPRHRCHIAIDRASRHANTSRARRRQLQRDERACRLMSPQCSSLTSSRVDRAAGTKACIPVFKPATVRLLPPALEAFSP